MADRTPDNHTVRSEVRFDNGNVADSVTQGPTDDARGLITRLGLETGSRPVIVVCGGADRFKKRHLRHTHEVLGPGVAAAAATCEAAVVDGGTNSGVMTVVGEARWRNKPAMPMLIGVAPRGKVHEPTAALEPHHSHFVLADSLKWGGETALLFELAATIAPDARVVVVLAGGGENARREALEAKRRDWPLIIVKGSGGIGAKVASTRWVPTKLRGFRSRDVRRLAAYSNVRVFSSDKPELLTDYLTWELIDQPALKQAWRIFGAYDSRATKLQSGFVWLLRAIIVLGIAATAAALLDTRSGLRHDVVHWTTMVLPAVVALLIAWSGRRAVGKRWVLVRAAAEAIRSETFRYRTITPPYDTPSMRDGVLAGRLAVINKQLLTTEAASGPLSRLAGPGPPDGAARDSLNFLSPAQYAGRRTADQISYYHRRIRGKARWRDGLQLVALLMGGTGTVLAASGLESWVAATTAVSAGAVSYLTSLQHEHDIVVYNQSAGELDSVQLEWVGSAASSDSDEAVIRLVDRTEAILTEEVGAWARRMARAMDDATRQQREGNNHSTAR